MASSKKGIRGKYELKYISVKGHEDIRVDFDLSQPGCNIKEYKKEIIAIKNIINEKLQNQEQIQNRNIQTNLPETQPQKKHIELPHLDSTNEIFSAFNLNSVPINIFLNNLNADNRKNIK